MNPSEFLKSKNVSCLFAKDEFTNVSNASKEYQEGFTKRTIGENNICAEIDIREDLVSEETKKKAYEITERNFEKLAAAGYEEYLFGHKGKSPWIWLYNFEGMNKENQKGFFIGLVEKYFEPLPEGFRYDLDNYNENHWVNIELANHRKYKTKNELVKVANEGAKNIIDLSLVKSTQKPDKRKVNLGYSEILAALNPSEQERVSCIMQIFNKHNYTEQELIDYVCLKNNWQDYNADTTANKIKEIYSKYSKKENPIKKETKKEEVELKEVPSNSMADFSNYYSIFKDTHSHLPAYQLIEAELGLEGENYYPLKKHTAYKVESLRQKATRFEIGAEVSDNRIHTLVMAGAGRGKGQLKKVLMKLDSYQEERAEQLYEKPMSFELPATRLNNEQLVGKMEVHWKQEPATYEYNQITGKKTKIPGERLKEETENPGILTYRNVVVDEAAGLVCEKTPSYETIMLDSRKSMDTFGDNFLDKRQVDNKNQLRFPSPTRWTILVHECVLPACYFDRGTFRRLNSFHITAPEISEDAAYDCFDKVSQSSKLKEYINTPSFDIQNLTFTTEAITELKKWIKTWNRFALMNDNKKIRAIGQRSFTNIRHYFLKNTAVLAITKGISKVEEDLVKQASFDTVHFLLSTFECYANNSTVNLSRDIWRTEDPRKAETLEWMFYNKALDEKTTPLTIAQVQEKISESFGVNDRMARGIFAEMKRDNLIDSKQRREYSRCWMAFTPKAEGVVLIADRQQIDLVKFLLEEKQLIKQGGNNGNGGNGGNTEMENHIKNAQDGNGGKESELPFVKNKDSIDAKSQELPLSLNNSNEYLKNPATIATREDKTCVVCKFELGVEQVPFGKVMRWVGVNCLPKVKLAIAEQARVMM